MLIGLHSPDPPGFPNLALMKLGAHARTLGQEVEPCAPGRRYDLVYSSKVFTYSTDPGEVLADTVVLGGWGNRLPDALPEEVEHARPAYDLYGLTYGLGFLTRGCDRGCPWCTVPEKEGPLRAHAKATEFVNGEALVLLDNNVLGHPHGIEQIEELGRLGLRVDFNQGLDARLIDDGIARRLGRLRWLEPLRLACDTTAQLPAIRRAVELLRWHNVTPRRYSCYLLVRDLEDALERVRVLKGLDLDPFAQPFIGPDGAPPARDLLRFARWVNHRAAFKTCTWEDYKAIAGDAIGPHRLPVQNRSQLGLALGGDA
jgi:hypothetical protein